MEDLLERWQDDEEREERQEETLSSPILRNRILLVEGVFGVLIVLLIFGVFAFITLCCVCRYTRSVYNATLRRGGGGAVRTDQFCDLSRLLVIRQQLLDLKHGDLVELLSVRE